MTVEQVDRSGGRQELEVHGALQSFAAGADLHKFAADVRAAVEIGMALGATAFVPMSYRKRGEKWLDREEVAATAAAAMLAGRDVGLSPMQSWQAIDVIEGRPALNALAQRGLVQAAGHEVWVHERSGDAPGNRASVFVTVRGRRKVDGRIVTEAEATWSLDRARQASLVDKKNWQRHPEAMCLARATSEVCRQIAADVLLGLAYSIEELQDEDLMSDAGGHVVQVRPQQSAEQPESVQVSSEPGPAAISGEPYDKGGEFPAAQVRVNTGEPARVHPPEPESARPMQSEPQRQPQPDTCAQVADDGRRCQRPPGHTGRHYFGRAGEGAEPGNEPETAPQPQEQPSQPEEGAEFLAPADELFHEPTDAELEAAYLAEQEARAAQNPDGEEPAPGGGTEALPGVAEEELPPEMTSPMGVAPVAPAVSPADRAATEAAQAAGRPDPEQADDPWKDFR